MIYSNGCYPLASPSHIVFSLRTAFQTRLQTVHQHQCDSSAYVTEHAYLHVHDHHTLPAHCTAVHVSFRPLATVPQRVHFYVVHSVPHRLSRYDSFLNSVELPGSVDAVNPHGDA